MQEDFKKSLWITAGIIFGTLIVASIVLFFIAGQMSATVTSIAQARTLAATQETALEDLVSLKQDAASAAAYQANMNKLLAPQNALIDFSNQVDALSRADGVSDSFSFQGSAVAATPNTAGSEGFTLSISGPISNLISFMKDFESAAPILLSSISNFRLTGSNGNYTVDAEGVVYFH